MASRKEYEMLFKLNSQLGSSFTGSFQRAQKELTAMQRQIEEFNRAQSDINAYQKQQQAVDATQKKLELLQKQYDNIQREMQETGGFSSDLENKLLSKRHEIEKTSTALQQQTQKLDQMGRELKEAGVDTSNLGEESKRLRREIEETRQAEEDFGDSGAMAFDVIASAIAAAGIATALREIGKAYMECVRAAGDFEEGMSNVEALSGATAREMDLLSDKAMELGATTKFTAQEASDAMGYMAMAGWDANEMLSGMDGVLQLAAASGEDLAMVSDIVTDNLTAFGLKASDTARFADVLAAAATNSNTSVSIMGETFKTSASIAGALGYSVEDVAVAVGLMANAGVKGSIAGTALKNTFNGLLEGVTLTSNAFGDYSFTALRADGTMKTFSETIDELRVYFEQMTEAERVNNAMALAGQRGYNGLLAILNATDEDYASLTESINNCTGAAQRMAEIKMDNMNGQLTKMKSAWDVLKISVGKEFTPVMQKLYAIMTDILTDVTGFVQEHPVLIKAIATFVGIIGAATAALTAFAAISKVVQAINLVSLFATAGPIMLGVAAVGALGAGIVALISKFKEQKEATDELTDSVEENQEALEGYTDETDEAAAASNEATIAIGETKAIMEELTKAYEDAYEAAFQSVHGQYELWDEAADVVATSAESINSNLQGQIAYWQDYNANLASLRERTGDIEGLSSVIASFADGSKESVNAVAGMAAASDEDLAAMVKNWQELQEAQESVSSEIAELKTNFTEEMDELGRELRADIEGMNLEADAKDAARATIQGYIDGADGMMDQVSSAYARVARQAAIALRPHIKKSDHSGMNAYASGTESANPGFALVGEHGPELVFMNGGEKVMSAEETAAMRGSLSSEMQMVAFAPQLLRALSSSGRRPVDVDVGGGGGGTAPAAPINITFQINGNVTEAAADRLRAYGEEFAERVREVMADVNAENNRRVYR